MLLTMRAPLPPPKGMGMEEEEGEVEGLEGVGVGDTPMPNPARPMGGWGVEEWGPPVRLPLLALGEVEGGAGLPRAEDGLRKYVN